jgi:hypothetical protein
MSNRDIKIYQIYHRPELKDTLDPAFVPFDHCKFTQDNPEESNRWREWKIVSDLGLKQREKDGADIWGFVSYKWAEKTQVPGQKFVDFIRNNPDNDVWFMEPHYKPFSPFVNGWIQGDIFHPGISRIPNSFLMVEGVPVDVRTIPAPLCYYNFFAGTEAFWTKFLTVINQMIEICQNTPELRKLVFETGAGHGNDPTVPYFIFVVERMFPTIITITGMRYAGLKYHTNDFLVKTEHLVALLSRYIK